MLEKFLSEKPLYYDEIDYTRMPRIYESIKTKITNPKIIHIIGTNGKGTTGRFLASALHSLGFNVGHYTSPHILYFNERVWLNGEDIDDETLEIAHKKLQNILPSKDYNALSYFEYTTLLAMIVYEKCEYVVMEAGLGGENDATAVFKKILTLVTPIALDHEVFLGKTITSIATTKLNAIQNNAILAEQIEPEVYTVAKNLATTKSLTIKELGDILSDNDKTKIEIISTNLNLPHYLKQNLSLSISALNFLDINYNKESFNKSRLFGRLTYIQENIIVDVGHNPLAAQAIKDTLYPQKYTLVYNSYKDKNYRKILNILKPIIKNVEIIPIYDKRAEVEAQLKKSLNDLKIECSSFKKISRDKNYLVFGSFSVVEVFINIYKKGMEN